MYDVLISGSLLYTGDEVIREGYVYVRGGRIADYGSGPAPEDYTYATLVLGGPHRVIVPGLAVAADVAAYPIRFRSPSMLDRVKFYNSVSPELLALGAIFGVYELHMSGVTSIIIESIDERVVDAVAKVAGGFYGIAWPSCAGEPESTSKPLVIVGSDECPAPETPPLFLESRPSYSLSGLDAEKVWLKSLELRKKAGLPGGRIREGERAEIAVFDARRPPLAFIEQTPEKVAVAPFLGAKVETLLAGDEVLVDAGQHLNIVLKHFTEALSKLSSKIL